MQTTDPGTTAPETVDADTEQPDYSGYLRRITFLDTSPMPDPDGAPVHLALSLLLNGEEHRELVDPRFGWQVFDSGIAGTVVSFVANAEYVEMGEAGGIDPGDGHQLIKNRALCGIPVLTPTQENHPWEVLSDDEVKAICAAPHKGEQPPDPQWYDVRSWASNYPMRKQLEPPKLVRVYVFAREVEVTAVPNAKASAHA